MILWCLSLIFVRKNIIVLIVLLIAIVITMIRLLFPIVMLIPRRRIMCMVYLMVPRVEIIPLAILMLHLPIHQLLLGHLIVCGWLRRTNSYAGKCLRWIRMDHGQWLTNHMTGDKELFIDDNLSHSSQKYITFGDNNKGKAIGLGKVGMSKD